jgi:hypothetical protein
MKNKISLLILLAGFLSQKQQAQSLLGSNLYEIVFTDKNNSPYNVQNPEVFLSARALSRRTIRGIQLSAQDFPVNPSYVQGVAQTGAVIRGKSRWRNSVLVLITDSSQLNGILQLPYVNNAGALNRLSSAPDTLKFKNDDANVALLNQTKSISNQPFDYGIAAAQINQIAGEGLHQQGYLGQDMVIAVFDAGFPGVNTLPIFDSLRSQNRLLGTWDFAGMSNQVFSFHPHGTNTLSCMAANLPGVMIGTAPRASFYLYRTEVAETENPVEEYYWVEAAEAADSVGADIISSSLGYTTYDRNEQSYSTQDMNGSTAICTNGADIAVSKGMLVVNSAGNSGASSWRIISAPADGDSVFAIGAVNREGFRAGFSSKGPTADFRIKPDVCALGEGAAIALNGGGTGYANGTSFSCPIIAGMSACLWQALPGLHPTELMTRIRLTASLANTPDTYYGWGIPNFSLALLGINELSKNTTPGKPVLFPNPVGQNELQFLWLSRDSQTIRIRVFDAGGREVINTEKYIPAGSYQAHTVDGFPSLYQGVYVVHLQSRGYTYVSGVIR